MTSLYDLLKLLKKKGASDLHVTTGTAPQLRIDGKLQTIKMSTSNAADTRKLAYSILTDEQRAKFEKEKELDLSFGIKDMGRFRANIFMQRGAVAASFRNIPTQAMTFEELGIPPSIQNLVKIPRGLVLVSGPTGSGKSTTLTALIDQINNQSHVHIITIEDPIEFLHVHKKALINQREVGTDTDSFKKALKSILRQDPDIVLIGELRDLETIDAALTIAETGHLCFATLHTNNCVQTINRIIDVFPPYQQQQVRAQLSFVLEGVVSQQLISKVESPGRVLAMEIMIPIPAIRNLIRDDKIHQIYSQMQIGQSKHHMLTMNQSLNSLYQQGIISLEDALGRSSDPDELRNMIVSQESN